jgi:Rnl2 family RNA ligase
MDNFVKFPSIENVYNSKYITAIKEHISDEKCANIPWVVTEKVHGANLQFCTDGQNVKLGKRTSYIEEKDMKPFYNSDKVFSRYKDRVVDAVNLLAVGKLATQPTTVTIYGELFGGRYNGHARVYKNPVQKEVLYCPEIEFYVFDVCVNIGGKQTRLDFDTMVKLCEKVNFLYSKELFRGSFDDCLKFSANCNNHLTTIPKYFGLDDISSNIREGNVIKPVQPLYHHKTGDCFIVKDKNAIFRENNLSQPAVVVSELAELVKAASNYINTNRLNSLISKVGQPIRVEDKKDIASLASQLSTDAMDDFIKDNADINADKIKPLKKALLTAAYNFIYANADQLA